MKNVFDKIEINRKNRRIELLFLIIKKLNSISPTDLLKILNIGMRNI